MPLLHFSFIEIVSLTTYNTNFLLACTQNTRDFLTESNFYLSNFDLSVPTYQKHLSPN